MENPLISFIVPVYGAEKYLDRCIHSILKQKINNWELILVDDESPDKSGAMCDNFAKQDNRIKVIHKKNGGQGSARNTGATAANGKWLMFVDDDDWLDENMSEECMTYLTDDIDILVFSRKDIYKKACRERKLNLSNDILCFETEAEKQMLQINMLNFYAPDKYDLSKVLFAVPWGKFFRRTFWEENSLSFIEGYGEDRPCLLRAYGFAKKILYLNKCYYNYWIHESTMRRYLENAHDRYYLSLQSIHNYVETNFADSPSCIEALRHTDIAYFSYYVIQDYCHRLNPQSYHYRKTRFFQELRKQEFSEAFSHADLSCLPFRRRILALLIQTQNFFLINAMCRINDVWNHYMFNRH